MKRYDSYKPSGIEWIGEIPSHWSVNRLKFEIGLHGRIGWNGLRSDEFQVVSHAYLVTGQDFDGSDIPWGKCYQIDKERYEEDPFIQLTEGDILVTKDGSIGKVAMVRNLDKPACLNSGIFVLKQKHNAFNQLYLYWLLNSDVFKGFISYHQSGSTILHLYQNVFDNMPTLVPPMEEQIIMSNYLEKKCGEIDRSIAKQQRRIELLEELKQPVITQAVTRGLDPNVPLRESGIEWIGEIPVQWHIAAIKRYSSLSTGCTPTTGNPKYYDSEDIIWFTPGDFTSIKLIDSTRKLSILAKDENACRMYPKNTVYFVAIGATIGKVAYCEQEASSNQQVSEIISDEKNLHYKYITYALRCQKEEILLTANLVTLPIINQDKIGSLKVPIPPFAEQKAVADYLDKRCAEIDSMIEREKKKIELMQELKQSIITEVVTGKRKVV